MRLVSAAQMRELDRRTIEDLGIPGMVLMENAGRGAYDVLRDRWPEADTVVVLAGKGNNGGDGFVVGRYLVCEPADVRVLLFGAVDDLKGDARTQHDLYTKLGGETVEIPTEEAFAAELAEVASADLVVDALFGTGLERDVEGRYAEAIETVNALGVDVLAIDMPSGLSSETGHPLGVAIEADATATFAYAKTGLATYPGPEYAGDVEVIDIGIPDAFVGDLPADLGMPGELLDLASLRARIAPRALGAHKGDAGHVLVLAGSMGMSGAARLVAAAAGRSGAGLVTLAVPSAVNLPFGKISSADLKTFGDATGDIELTMSGERLLYSMLWPNARLLRLKRPRPVLRALRQPDRVAEILGQALTADQQAAAEPDRPAASDQPEQTRHTATA